MTRDKMMDLLALLNPWSAKTLSLAGVTDEHLEFALFHEAQHIAHCRIAQQRNKEEREDA